MGGVYTKSRTSLQFLFGFSIGFGTIWYAHEDAFTDIRLRFFPVIDIVEIKVDPKAQKAKLDKNKILNRLNELETKENSEDDEYKFFIKSARKMKKLHDLEDEKWAEEQKLGPKTPEEAGEGLVEFEAVKRLNKKLGIS